MSDKFKDKMEGICSLHGEDKRKKGLTGNHWEKSHFVDQSVDYNVKTGIKETVRESVDWINLAQDKDKRWAVVKTVMTFRIP
jgi:hypothetical protein